MEEEWRSCKDFYPYEISNTGKVRNRRSGRIMKTFINTNSYEAVNLQKDGQNKVRPIHRLIAEAFIDGDHTGLDVNHIDGNKRNNDLSNLEFCTRQENTIHGFRMGLNWSHKRKKVRIIETDEVFDSITECAQHLGVDRTSVGACVNGSSKTCRGYHIEIIV